MTYEITANTGRCEALTVSDIPVYRCTSVATADRDGHAVCAAHSRARFEFAITTATMRACCMGDADWQRPYFRSESCRHGRWLK